MKAAMEVASEVRRLRREWIRLRIVFLTKEEEMRKLREEMAIVQDALCVVYESLHGSLTDDDVDTSLNHLGPEIFESEPSKRLREAEKKML